MSDQQSIFFLAENKSFDNLSQSEKDFVLQEMSQAAFEELHQSIQLGRQFFATQEQEISPAVKPRLNTAFRAKYSSQKTLWIQQSIPIWQAAAACSLVAILSWVFLHSDDVKVNTETIYVYQTDTIYQDALIVNQKPQKSVNHPSRKNAKTTFPVAANQSFQKKAEAVSVMFELERIPKVSDSIVVFQSKKGQSVKDDTLLMNWGGEIF
ncbi:MAG: hypothetical protein AAFO82_11325 [Bacteroidota bacterium]